MEVRDMSGRAVRVSLALAFGILIGGVRPSSAQLAGRSAEEWIKTLETPTRIASLKISDTIEALKLKPGQTIGDIGAGTGLFTLPMALKVKPGGTVYGVDIDKELVDYISEKATEQGMTNVQGVLGAADDPNMPGNVDLALINDVLHHIEKRAEYLKQLAAYLNPGGRIAVIEFKPEQSPHKTEPALVVSEEQTTTWMAAAGLKPVERLNLFTDKYFVIYALTP
jgi:ubiquinone/menaquinone biosynthesis C-methylase UbiE